MGDYVGESDGRFGFRFWVWLAAAAVVVGALAIILGGCSGGGIQIPGFTTSGGDGGGGGGLSGMLPAANDTLASLGWWLTLAGGVSIFAGLFRAWKGDWAGAATAVGVGVGLIVLNGIVRVLLPAFFTIAVCGSVGVGLWAAYRLATGRGVGGHRLWCLWRRLVGRKVGQDPCEVKP